MELIGHVEGLTLLRSSLINKFLSNYYPFLPVNDTFDNLPIRLLNVKKLEEKINEGKEQISFVQTYLNLVLFNLFSTPDGTQDGSL